MNYHSQLCLSIFYFPIYDSHFVDNTDELIGAPNFTYPKYRRWSRLVLWALDSGVEEVVFVETMCTNNEEYNKENKENNRNHKIVFTHIKLSTSSRSRCILFMHTY